MSNDEPQSLRDVAIRIKDLHPGVPGRQLDKKAKKDGLKITYTTINSMAAGTYDSIPSVETVEALIALADYPRELVYLVAGVPMPLKPLADDLPPDADSLEPKQRKVVIDAIRQFAHQNRENAVLRSELRKVGTRDAADLDEKSSGPFTVIEGGDEGPETEDIAARGD